MRKAFTMDTGSLIKWMALAALDGPRVECMLVSGLRITRMESEFYHSREAMSILVNS